MNARRAQRQPRMARPGYNKRGFQKNNKAPPAAWFDPPMKALFVGRPPIPFIPPPILDFKPPVQVTGVFEYMKYFETEDACKKRVAQELQEKPETKEELRERLKAEKKKVYDEKLKLEIENWKKEKDDNLNPNTNSSITANPMSTLFVARLSYQVTENDLRRVLEEYGKIKKITLIKDNTQQNNNSDNSDNKKLPLHRGYGFVEYENEESVRMAYKRAEGVKILGKRIRVDVERGRTVENWLPRRLGGGKGTSRMTRKKTKTSTLQSYKDKRGRRSSKYSRHMKEKKKKKSDGGLRRGTKRQREY